MDVASYVVGNNIEGRLYVENNMKDTNIKVVNPKCIYVIEGNESCNGEAEADESDDNARKVRFNDGRCQSHILPSMTGKNV